MKNFVCILRRRRPVGADSKGGLCHARFNTPPGRGFHSVPEFGYPWQVMTPEPDTLSRSVLLFASDLLFETRIRSTAATLGITLNSVRTVEAVLEQLAVSSVCGLIVDLDCGEDAVRVIEAARRDNASCPILAYGPHVQVALFERARVAGADDVLPRSRFTQQLPTILQSMAATP